MLKLPKYLKLLILLGLTVVLVSCNSTKTITDTTKTTNQSDNISHEQTIIQKDTIIKFVGDTVYQTIPCDVDTQYIVKSRLGSLLVQVKNGKVHTQNIVNDYDFLLKQVSILKEDIQKHRSDSSYVNTVFKEVPVKYIPKFFMYCTIGFFLLIALTLIALKLRILKF